MPEMRQALNGEFDGVYIARRNLNTPEAVGCPKIDEVLPGHRLQFFAQNAKVLTTVLSEALEAVLAESDTENCEFFYADDEKDWPGKEHARKRQKRMIQKSGNLTDDSDDETDEEEE